MSLSKPRLASMEFGVKRFLLNPDHFNEPCKLFDIMTQDVEICAAGVFVGELSHLPEHTLEAQIRQVNLIKSVIKNDRDRTGKERQFMPIIQERACLWADFGSLSIVPQVPKGREYCQKRRQFIDLLVTTDICEPKEKSKLELSLASGGINSILDDLYAHLSVKENEVWYGPGLPMPEGKSVDLSPDLSMTNMNSPYINNLVNLKNKDQKTFIGINSPTIYLGTQNSTFCCHIEDFSFESVNRSVAGSEKIWFFVPPSFYVAFCEWMSQCGVQPEVGNCSTFLQHKHNFIDPRAAVKAGFPVRTVRQRVGDVLYVLPFAIHWGVNLGFTVNEAVNCSSKSWLRSGLISRPICRCPTVPQSMQTVQLDGVLVAAGATPQMIERWKYGQHLEVMATLDVRNPCSGKQGACPVDITLLLGKDQKDYDLDCKELTSIMAPFAGHKRGEYIGGLVCLDDDDDELKENDICNADEQQDMRHKTDQLSSRLDYKCPFPCKCPCECTCECGYAAKTKGQPDLTALTSHIHVNHKQHPQYHTILQEVSKKYDKKLREGNYLVCELCHERVAQNGKSDFNLKRHQASSKCQRKRGQGPLQPSTSKQEGQKRKFDTD